MWLEGLMQVGDRVRDKLSGDRGFVERISADGKIATLSVGAGPDKRLSDYPIKDLEIDHLQQTLAGIEYDPFKQVEMEYDPFERTD
jgi:hypothetical protein